jgi:hypothetical protein
MSDGYISSVPSEIELERPEDKAQQVTQWMIAKEIVAAQQTDWVFGSPVAIHQVQDLGMHSTREKITEVSQSS